MAPRFRTKMLLIICGVLAWLLALLVSLHNTNRELSDVSGAICLSAFTFTLGVALGGISERRTDSAKPASCLLPTITLVAIHALCWCLHAIAMLLVSLQNLHVDDRTEALELLLTANDHHILNGIAAALALMLFAAASTKKSDRIWAIGSVIVAFWLVLFAISYVACAGSLPWDDGLN